LHGPVPLQAPLQPEKIHPAFGVAFRVTGVFGGYKWVHVPGHWMKLSVLVTVPLPLKDTVKVSKLGSGDEFSKTDIPAWLPVTKSGKPSSFKSALESLQPDP